MKYLLIALVTSIVACSSSDPRPNTMPTEKPATPKADLAQSEIDAAEPRRFDAQLSTFEYPYEVAIFELKAQKKTYEMAYMDVKPDEPNGQTVLLLHGKNFSGAYWANTIAPLVEAGYRVVAPDQIGFGKSSKPADFQYSFHALATHTRALLDEVGAAEVAVVGHSMGGMLATRFALMFPDMTSKLVLVNPIGLEDWKRMVPYVTIDEWYQRELKKTPEKVRTYMTTAYFDGEWKDEYQPLVELQAGWTLDSEYPQIAWVSALTYDMIFTQPVVYEFDRIQVPTLLIIGDRDRTALGRGSAPREVTAKMGLYDKLGKKAAAAIPNAKLVELDGIGHIPQYEAFDAYYDSLSDFLSE